MPENDRFNDFNELIETLHRIDGKLDAFRFQIVAMKEIPNELDLKSLLREALEIQSLRAEIKDLDERLRKLEN